MYVINVGKIKIGVLHCQNNKCNPNGNHEEYSYRIYMKTHMKGVKIIYYIKKN